VLVGNSLGFGVRLTAPAAREDHLAVEGLPLDPSIPALRALHERGLGPVLARVGLDADDGEARVRKYHPGNRCTLQVDKDEMRMALKLYVDDPSSLAALLRRFEREGLATGSAPTVPRLLGYDEELRFIATAWLEGPSGKQLIEEAHGERTAELALGWLYAAREVPIELGEEFGAAELLGLTEQRVRKIRSEDPALAPLATHCYEELAVHPPVDGPRNVRHASFKPSSIIDVGGPGLIDWDGYRQGALEYEAAGFLSALSRRSQNRHAPASELEELRRTQARFRDGLAGLADPQTLNWYLAAELVKHAARLARRQPRDWKERALGILEDARAALKRA
jgi:phosphotransferase family enzyme